MLPLTTAQDTLVGHSGQLNQILVEATTASSVTAAESEATAILTPNHSNTDGTAAFINRRIDSSATRAYILAVNPSLRSGCFTALRPSG